MAYVALYRKYRPIDFSSMVGQEHIVKILKNQIETGKISHAYIFSGTRGTGKTTAAKVFARAINCLNPKDGEPCNECEACKSILDGNTTDVVEMDAASNNSVENIRSIRQEVAYSTTSLKYKVYIIDEAHMLSASAFNALLKTLEEPPANVVFILATTEEHKILPTILSRCIRFEFKKIGVEDIVKRLKEVLEDTKREYEDNALLSIAKLADGGMRDALSILERCLNADEGKITDAALQEIIGIVPKETIKGIVCGILDFDVSCTNERVNEILKTGKDLRNITSGILNEFLALLVAKSSDDFSGLDEDMKERVMSATVTRLNEIIKHLSNLDEVLRLSTNEAVIFKAKMLELATNVKPLTEDSLIKKIEELEMKIEKLEKRPVNFVEKQVTKTQKSELPKEEIKEKAQKKEDAVALKVPASKKVLKEIENIKKRAIELDNLKLFSALSGVNGYIEEDTVVISTENGFAYGVLNKDSSKEDLKKIIKQELDSDYNIRIEYNKKEENKTNSFEQIVKGADVPFEIID